jgi:hypothetical protein
MLRGVIRHIRRQPVAFAALFVALGGGAMAANNFIKSTDTIPAGDLAGSTYRDPLIANGAITAAKTDTSSVQERVSSSCDTGSAIRVISATGGVTCQTAGGLSPVDGAQLGSVAAGNGTVALTGWSTAAPFPNTSNFNGATGIYTAPAAGTYQVTAVISAATTAAVTASIAPGASYQIELFRNATTQIDSAKFPILDVNQALVLTDRVPLGQSQAVISDYVSLAAGDQLSLAFANSTGDTFDLSGSLSIARVA